jgi:chromosome partitioning protein
MKAISVTNQKGGVAKTTTVRNVAAALVEEGQRVLLVDLDPQANLTTGVGLNPRAIKRSIYDVLVHKVPLAEVIQHAPDGFDIAPSDETLMRAEMEMGDKRLGWVRELRKSLDPVRGNYDYCLFDTPPIRGFLTVNALVAADYGVIIPFVPERDPVMGMQLLLARMQELLPENPSLRVIACVPCMVDRNWKTHTQMVDEIARRFPGLPFTAPVMRHADFPKASELRMSILAYAPNGNGAKRYREVAHHVLRVPQPPAMMPVA